MKTSQISAWQIHYFMQMQFPLVNDISRHANDYWKVESFAKKTVARPNSWFFEQGQEVDDNYNFQT